MCGCIDLKQSVSGADPTHKTPLGDQAAHQARGPPHGGELRQASGAAAAEGRLAVDRPAPPAVATLPRRARLGAPARGGRTHGSLGLGRRPASTPSSRSQARRTGGGGQGTHVNDRWAQRGRELLQRSLPADRYELRHTRRPHQTTL